MKISVVSALSPAMKENLDELLCSCREREPVTLKFPQEEDVFYVLLSADGMLCTAAAFYKEEEGVFSCTAFTRPEYRRQGFFSAALKKGLELLPEETDLLFYTDEKSPDALGTLKALEAERISTEYMMELSPNEFFANLGNSDADRNRPSGNPGTDNSACTLTDGPVPGHPGLTVMAVSEDGSDVLSFLDAYGSVRILPCPSHYYLYGFEIKEAFRGMGHGQALLKSVLSALFSHKKLPVTLQVSGQNLPALSLYKKTGFRITETLSCFLY